MFFLIKCTFFYKLIHGIIKNNIKSRRISASNTTLHNENVSVTLKSLGAELTSIKDASGTEYLWQGNPEFPGVDRLLYYSQLLDVFEMELPRSATTKHAFLGDMDLQED